MWEYRAEIVRVVDADTLDLDIDFGFGVTKRERVRLARIDAWETRGEEREKGLIAKDVVLTLAEQFNWECIIRTEQDKGKYGRYIAEVIFDFTRRPEEQLNLSDYLLKEGHAELYK